MASRSNGVARRRRAQASAARGARQLADEPNEHLEPAPTPSLAGITQRMPQAEPQALNYMRILQRRKWAIIQMLLLGPLVALVISLRQAPEYSATTGVLLSLDRAATAAPGAPVAPEDPARVVQNQAQVARALPVAERVVRATGNAFPNANALLKSSSVSTKEGVDVLTFSVTHGSPAAAVSSRTSTHVSSSSTSRTSRRARSRGR